MKHMNLNEYFDQNDTVAIAFSGGVDSAYLLYIAGKCAKKVTAYYVRSAFQPEFEYRDAKRHAGELGITMKVIDVDILSCNEVIANPPDRCYYCKKAIMSEIIKNAKKDGYTLIVDGTNASDDFNDRPGAKALAELRIESPLRICGLTKDKIREYSKEAELFTADKPSYACLATRIETGNVITKEDLERTEKSESYLHSLGFYDFRIRLRRDAALEQKSEDKKTPDKTVAGKLALIQIKKEQLSLYKKYEDEITDNLMKDYDAVILDSTFR